MAEPKSSKPAAKSAKPATRTPAGKTAKAAAPKPVRARQQSSDALGSKATRRPSRQSVRSKSTPPPRPALRVVPDPAPHSEHPSAGKASGRSSSSLPFDLPFELPFDLPADPTALVQTLVSLLRAAGTAAGLSGDDLDRRIAGALAFLRRRITGDYAIDDFGFDEEFTREVWLPLLRPLYKRWFRVEVRGVENIPSEGRGLVVANHSGTVPVDGLMTQVAIHDEHPNHRFVRMLGADLVFQSPFIGELSRKSGTTLAANPDAERLLESDELVAVFPEGFKGVGKPFSDRYRLQRFGRGGFVSAAVRAGAPIIPCSIVGAEEIFPMIGNAKGIARLAGFPYFPITPFFPLFGLLGAIPLPSKWIIEFGEPIETAQYGSAAADDPMVLFDVTDQVRETIQQTLYSLLLQRRSVFF
ncbi:lysophospholipid acyltransferase family protein [Yimella sp. cx-51]|uniref:lysophospholipid acyltransferase family protein n=1 Tax=Yimella sp. cx-51 TaxID=2770551 RepID=UPI00165EA700|nr:lysophospholipid acyltransferase family protein [Yimella sp. cx-51]MBC9956338.1 1-acyl-sn-glycerol-3-phosphate acyltransferase [Yimella sp. cx-51]QTH38533.1 1-acyl-sn-glycerol-3-phosphate acyltransferase [Yimella sp. cx-51]